MCGPLVLQTTNSTKGHLFYQIGRLISYQILGFILFLLSNSIFKTVSKSLQEFSFYILVILYIYIGVKIWYKKVGDSFSSTFFSKQYSIYFKKILKTKNKSIITFLMGLISALLPCGLLHTFLLGVIPIENPLTVFIYIFSFWLATSPVLLGVNFSLRKIKERLNIKSPKILGAFYLLMGGYLIYIRYFDLIPGIKCH